jgi:hypothetical protein
MTEVPKAKIPSAPLEGPLFEQQAPRKWEPRTVFILLCADCWTEVGRTGLVTKSQSTWEIAKAHERAKPCPKGCGPQDVKSNIHTIVVEEK